ncbi:MAG: FAD binding domain-containing protein [Fervidicoccaceae archaeon]
MRAEVPIVFRTTLPELEGYLKPKTLEEALEILDELNDQAKIYAGGTDLLIDIRLRGVRNKVIVDIKGIKELKGIREEGDRIVIGATTTIAEIRSSQLISSKLPLLRMTTERFADQFIRARATIGGNICNASPAADTSLSLLVYGAEVELASRRGKRIIPLSSFFTGVKRTAIAPGELVVSIKVPVPRGRQKVKYLRYDRSAEDLMIVGIAGAVFEEPGSSNKIINLSYGAVAPIPLLFSNLQDALERGGEEEILRIVKERVSPISDVRASREYRMHLIEAGTRLLLKELLRGGA